VVKRGLFSKMFGNKTAPVESSFKRFELISDSGNTFSPWKGNTFQSDIVRAAIRPKVNAVGKLNPKHIRGDGPGIKVNADPFIKGILQRPNPYMSMQDLLMKLTYQRELYHNAFAYIKRDQDGYPLEIYPITFNSVELLERDNEMFLKFSFRIGKQMVVPYADVIHLRKDFNESDLFGDSGLIAISNIMEVINTTDQGMINAVKNSAVIKWIMMFKQAIRPEDQQTQIDLFVKNYLSVEKSNGIAPADPRYELKQIEPKNYVPNAAQMQETIQRLYSYYGVNEAIVQNNYNEDEWNAFYESEIEPIAIQLSSAFTKAFFTVREQGFGNRIVFESSALQYASMATKLNLVQMVDRGAMTPNEWRQVMNLGPIENGDKPIRRLDTAEVNQTKEAKPDGP